MYRKIISLFILLSLVISLAACTAPAHQTEPTQQPTVYLPEPPAESRPTQPLPTEAPTEAPTQPAHSSLYIPGLEVDDVIVYFNEVCLDAEWVNSGDATRLQKWTSPIFLHIEGDATEADLSVMAEFTAWLNTIEGFPGISTTDDSLQANLRLHFCTQDEMLSIMGSDFTGLDGAVTYWYSDDAIYDAIICVRTDLDQHLRNSVILEEIYNGLGPIQDTDLRPDSIIYSAFSEPQNLTQIDDLILKLLYHPELLCGMNAAECEAVIRQIYY